MYEISGGFIVHFFSRDKVEHLARGFEIVSIDEFEEGTAEPVNEVRHTRLRN